MSDGSNELKPAREWVQKFVKESELVSRANWLDQFLKDDKETTYVSFLRALHELNELQWQILTSMIANETKTN